MFLEKNLNYTRFRINEVLGNLVTIYPNPNNGVFIIEFPYLVDTVEKNAFGQVYFEHLSYFTINPLKRLCDETGMKIIDVQKFDIHDGTARVVISHDYSNRDVEVSVEEFLNKEKESGYLDIDIYDNFKETVDKKMPNGFLDFVRKNLV